jgi:hypothetical protein
VCDVEFLWLTDIRVHSLENPVRIQRKDAKSQRRKVEKQVGIDWFCFFFIPLPFIPLTSEW